MINSSTVQFSQQTEHQTQGDPSYKLDCKKPVDRYAHSQAERYYNELKKTKVVTYRGLKRASGRTKRKIQRNVEIKARS